MKKTLYLAALLLASGCTRILDESPDNFISPENFYRNAADAAAAVNAAYSALNRTAGNQRGIALIGDVPSDDVAFVNPQGQAARIALDQYSHGPVNEEIEIMWRDYWVGVNRCNAAINRIPAIPMNEALKTRYLAECRLIRANLYFYMVRFWGDLPVVTTEFVSAEDLNRRRDPAAEVYNQLIIPDLQFAEANLPQARDYRGTDVGRVTSGAAKGLLAKVYLTLKQFGPAAAKAKEVMDQPGPFNGRQYELFPNYLDAFDVSKENGMEHVLSRQATISAVPEVRSFLWSDYARRGTGNSGAPSAFVNLLNAVGNFQPTQSIFQAYTATDRRLSQFRFSPGTAPNASFSNIYVNKYVDPNMPNERTNTGNDFPILRFADVLLMYAEALNETTPLAPDAVTAVNRVRVRAGLPALAGADLASQDALRQAIWRERRLELAFECQRWFDLVRTGRLVPVIRAHTTGYGAAGSANIKDFHVVLPVPQREMDVNANLLQNPGY